MEKENTGTSGLVLDATGLVSGSRTRQMHSYFRTALSVLLVGAGYYAGGLIGVSVRLPPSGVSIIWPATPVLLAVLLLTPVRLWWVYVLAVLPAHLHLVTHFQPGVPIVTMLSQYAGNMLHAVLGALAVRPFVGSPPRLDNLRSMAAFILLAAIAVSAVASAVAVYLFVLTDWALNYWLVWQQRFLSQILGAITVTPPLILLMCRGPAGWLKVPLKYYVELSLLTIGLFAVGIPAFGWNTPGAESFPGLLFAPLPLLLWAAVRLGPGALCFLLLVVALLSISNTFAGRGPFATLSPAENVLSLQIFLIAISVPLMFLAALIEERRSKEQALRFSEARYRAVVEDQTELICRLLPDGTYTFVNDAYCRYFQRSREELLGRSFWGFIPVEGHRAAREFLASITPEHPIATREHEVLGPDGELRWQQWRDRGFFDDQGRVVEYQAVGRDITERKQMETRLNTQYVITRILSEAASMVEAVPRVLQTICEQLDCEYGEIWRINREANVLTCVETWHLPLTPLTEFESASRPFVFAFGLGLPGRVWQTGKPVCMPDVTVDPDFLRATAAASAGLRGALGFPILSGDEVLGVIVLFAREIREADKDRLEMMTSIGNQMGQFIERKRAEQTLRENEAALRASYDRIQDLAGRLITAQEAERSRIAGDLHDDVNQQLAGLSIALSNVKRQLRNGGDATVEEELTRLQQRTVDLADVIRNLSHEMHPGVLQHAGLTAALKSHCAEFGSQHPIELTFSAVDVLDGIPQEVALCLYRVAQEALRNIAAHAAAHKAQVTLRSSEHNLEMVIADDGQGFDLAEAREVGGLGLISLDERVRLIGGSLAISTEPQHGTEVRVQVPLGGHR
jgi:PAS domain S-box-containing protein